MRERLGRVPRLEEVVLGLSSPTNVQAVLERVLCVGQLAVLATRCWIAVRCCRGSDPEADAYADHIPDQLPDQLSVLGAYR